MPKISYADMHCDSVTCACKMGEKLSGFKGQVNTQMLSKNGCSVQCFALFTEGENSAEDFDRFLAFYNAQIAIDPLICPVYRTSDLQKAVNSGKVGAVLTVENLGFIGNRLEKIDELKKMGVSMASPVWNNANALAYPNLIMRNVNGRVLPDFSAREGRGLTNLGKAAVERLNANKIIIDISHLSDGGAEDVLAMSAAPIVASHSNAASVCNVSRNLTDSLLRKIADKGGAVGLNFCRAFVIAGCAEDELTGGSITARESAFEWLYRHYAHMVNVGGEDLPALGSDFDGITPYAELVDCTRVQDLLEYFSSRGVKGRALDKLALGNFLRVFEQVVG